VIDRILIVEDEELLRQNLVRLLAQDDLQIDAVGTAEEALQAAAQNDYVVALVDVRLPGKDGIALTSEVLQRSPDTAVVLMTAYASVASVIDAIHVGAHDYLLKPVLMKEVSRKVSRARDHRRLARENVGLRQRLAEVGTPEIVAKSQQMRDLLAFVQQIAASTRPVLVQGESGSGKEVLARLLHDASPRRIGPFIAVSMSVIAEHMIESFLFGHEKGVFAAETQRDGLFRAASGGTLFLDDIGDMPLAHQAKLLRAIEAREVLPVGGDRPVPIDARIVAATSRDLPALVRENRFRADLYFRLSALRVEVPPLRSHTDNIPALVSAFLSRHAKEHGRPLLAVDHAAERCLMAYPWPGNVRELLNVVERAALVCSGGVITVADLPPEISGTRGEEGGGYQQAMEAFERSLIRSTLERVGGDRREAARALGLSLATLYRRIEKLGLKDIPSSPSPRDTPESSGIV